MVQSQRGGRKQLGQLLLEGAFIRPEDLEASLEISRRTGKKLGQVLVEEKYISPETLATTLSFQLGVPVIDLQQFQVQREAVELVPEALAREHQVLPLAVSGDTLTVAMEEPQNLAVIDQLSATSRKRIRPVIPIHGSIRDGITSNYRLIARLEDQMRAAAGRDVPQFGSAQPAMASAPVAQLQIQEPQLTAGPAPVTSESIAQTPVVRAFELIINQALRDRASDIHIQPQPDGVKIRYRVDGILHDVLTLPVGVHSTLLSRLKVLANMNIAEKRRPQDGQFSMAVGGGRTVDFRVATAVTNTGEMAVIRILDKTISVLGLTEVGLSTQNLETFQRLMQSAYGMILVSGPTGSGKTTTLYAALNGVDAERQNVITIEDPVEYEFPRLNQIQVNRQAGLTFATGLRAIVRMDPNVILVGEIRDNETAEVAVQAALTGHLVLSTIHANDAAGAMVRLVDLGVEPFLATSAVLATTSQRLIRKVCPYCSQLRTAPPEEAMAYQADMQEVRLQFNYGRGCNFCSQTGYLSRTGVHEILPMTDGVRRLITRNASASDIRAQAVLEGMTTMRRDGMLKARDGVTTPFEVIRQVFTIG